MTSVLKKISEHKFVLSFVLVLFVFISSGIILLEGLPALGNLTRTLYDHPLVVSNASLRAALDVAKMHHNMEKVVSANSPAEIEIALAAVAEEEAAVYRQLDTIEQRILGERGQALAKETRLLFIEWIPIREETVRLLKSGRRQDAVLLTQRRGAEHVAEVESKMMELTSYARNKATAFMEQSAASQSKLENIVRMIITFVVLTLLFVFYAAHRILKAEKTLWDEKNGLQKALAEINTLRGIIPICSQCKQIRDDAGSWKQMEEYIRAHSDAEFSHGICPDCLNKIYSSAEYKKNFPGEGH